MRLLRKDAKQPLCSQLPSRPSQQWADSQECGPLRTRLISPMATPLLSHLSQGIPSRPAPHHPYTGLQNSGFLLCSRACLGEGTTQTIVRGVEAREVSWGCCLAGPGCSLGSGLPPQNETLPTAQEQVISCGSPKGLEWADTEDGVGLGRSTLWPSELYSRGQGCFQEPQKPRPLPAF